MTLPRTVADVLADHVSFEVECIDRMYLNVYVPQLQYATGLVSYIHRQLSMPVAGACQQEHGGLVVLSSRFPFADLEGFDGGSARMLEVPPFTAAEGSALLAAAGGGWLAEDERRALVAAVDGHALATGVLAGLLAARPPALDLAALRAPAWPRRRVPMRGPAKCWSSTPTDWPPLNDPRRPQAAEERAEGNRPGRKRGLMASVVDHPADRHPTADALTPTAARTAC